MSNCLAAAFAGILVGTGALFVGSNLVLAQNLPPAPEPTAQLPQGAPGGSGSFVASAAANEHGSFLWVVDSIERIVTLCQTDGKGFTCSKKRLP